MGKKSRKEGGSSKKQRAAAVEEALNRTVAAAYSALPNALADLAPLCEHKRLGLCLRHRSAADLSEADLKWVMQLLETNMAPVFGPERWPEEAGSRLEEARHPETRFAVAYSAPSAASASPAGDGDVESENGARSWALAEALAFAQYRLVVEEGAAVLYVYELQVSEAARSRGVGKFLMLFVELLSKRLCLEGVMLTVQKASTRAFDFYLSKCRYRIDDISPSRSDAEGDLAGEYAYEILSKKWVAPAAAAL